MKSWIILFLLLLSFPLVSAGAGWLLPPASERTYFFEPGEHLEGAWTTHGSDYLEVYTGGDLAEFGTLVDPNPNGGSREISWELNLPNELTPGKHYFFLYARESAPDGVTMGGRGQAAAGIKIISLYEEPYILLDLRAKDIAEGSEGEATLTFSSWSKQTVTVYVDLEIYDENEQLLGKIKSKSLTLEPQEIVTDTVDLPTTDYAPGSYVVKATLRGAQEGVTAQSPFKIGTFTLSLEDYSQTIYVNTINPFHLTLRSNWNGETNGIYATVNLLNQSESTPITTIEKFGLGKLKTFIDANNVQPHMAEGTIDVYLEKEYHNTFPIKVNITTEPVEEKPEFIFQLNALTGLYLLLFLLVMLNIVLLFRRKHEKE